MENDEKIEERKQFNMPFLAAFDYMAMVKTKGKKGELAKLLKTNGSLISDYRKGRKRVSEDMMGRLWEFSERKLNKYYLMGISNYMLTENIPDDEALEMINRFDNPDFDLIKKEKEKQKTASKDLPTSNSDYIARRDHERMIDELNDRIAFLESQIAEKDKQISGLISKINQTSSSNYPFEIGAAESLRENNNK